MPQLPTFVRSLVAFLSQQIEHNHIEYMIPLESKGALLIDLALASIPADKHRPTIVYLRSLEFLPKSIRQASTFAIFDDFVFSGRTISNAIETMNELNIDRDKIHLLAFFKFPRITDNQDECVDVLSATKVPEDDFLSRLSQEQVLKYVQGLAVEHKIPASYDNLHWEIDVPPELYDRLMNELAETGSFLYYGRRGNFDASALLVRQHAEGKFFSLPKIRFWYNVPESKLNLTPISYSVVQSDSLSDNVEQLREILTPDGPTPRQSNFATFQARAFSDQVNLLGLIKPFLRRFHLVPKLNIIHLQRYFGPRSTKVIKWIEQQFDVTPESSIPSLPMIPQQPIDFYWIAVEVMRLLGKEYWTQTNPIKVSMGFSVSELVEKFSNASVESVHAAIDYCADMNLIATFFGWRNDTPFRAFRLTENGELEVGRNDGRHPLKLTSIEKLGALILAKSQNHEAPWWLLEKIPPILMRRFKFDLPQFQATMNFYGDTSLLSPTENPDYLLTWPRLATQMWEKQDQVHKKTKKRSLMFRLLTAQWNRYKTEILSDHEIVRVIGPMETLIELTKSKTMGHHVAILVDILSDEVGGCSYLSNSIHRAIYQIDFRLHMSEEEDYQRSSKEISNWLEGLDEKIELLSRRRERLLKHIQAIVDRLTKQRRGDLAAHLNESKPLPEGNRIVPAFKILSKSVRQIAQAAHIGNEELVKEVVRELVPSRFPTHSDEKESMHSLVSTSIKRWAVALSGIPQKKETYDKARLYVPEGARYRMYIVAYDLLGSSRSERTSRDDANRDRHIQSIINNWFIAFGGFAQRMEFGGGDLGFGFFTLATSAVQASLWAGYHLELLKNTNPSLRQDKPHAGFGITFDDILPGYDEQAKSGWLRDRKSVV